MWTNNKLIYTCFLNIYLEDYKLQINYDSDEYSCFRIDEILAEMPHLQFSGFKNIYFSKKKQYRYSFNGALKYGGRFRNFEKSFEIYIRRQIKVHVFKPSEYDIILWTAV